MGRGTCLGYLSPLGKSSAYLGRYWMGNESVVQWRRMVSRDLCRLKEMRVLTNGVGWYPASNKSELKSWILEQPERNSGCPSIPFILREFF